MLAGRAQRFSAGFDLKVMMQGPESARDLMTRGGPDNASSLLLYYIYETGFKYWDAGYAAALTAVLLAILAALALLQFGVLERRTHYQ